MAEKIRKKVYSLDEPIIPEPPKFHSLPPLSPPEFSHSGPPSLPDTPSIYPQLPKDSAPCPIQKHYRGFLEDYIEKIEEILEKFQEIKKGAEQHHYKSNCAKVTGTVVSSTGAALVIGSLWWAPFTAGTSLMVGAGGAVMSVTGSLTNALTDYIDYKTSANIMEDIKLLLKEKEMFDLWMQKSLAHFNECITQLMDEGLSRDIAISTIIEGIAKGAINIMEKPDNQVISSLSTAVKLHHIQHIAAETLPVIGKTFHMTEKSFQFIYNILGLTGRTVPSVIANFARISGVLSVAFAVADISILIKDLCSDHPSVEIIDKVIEKLKDQQNILMDLIGILKAVENNEDGIAKGAINIMEKPDNQVISSLSTAVKLHHIQHIAAETLPVIGKTFHMTEKSFQFIYNILGLTGRTVPSVIANFARISGVLSVAFAVADISILIKDLCSDHPSVEIIDKVIEKLKDQQSILMDLIGILKAVENNEDGIVERAMLDIQMIVDKEDLLKDFVIVNDDEFKERAGIAVQ